MSKAICKSTVMSNMWFGLLEFKKAGDSIEEHKHAFNHVTLLSVGVFDIIKYDSEDNIELQETVKAPCLIHIEKNKQHSITAKTDGAIGCCIHAIYENEKDLFPIDVNKVPVVGGSLKLSLLENEGI